MIHEALLIFILFAMLLQLLKDTVTFGKEDLKGVNFCWISLILLPFDFFQGEGIGKEAGGGEDVVGQKVIVNCN